MDEIIINKATVDDAETMADNRIKFAVELSGDKPKEEILLLKKNLVQYFQTETVNNRCISYIAKIDGNIAGIGSVVLRKMPGNFKNLSGKWGYIMNMYTSPEYRRKGICSKILRALVDEASKFGITAFELHATEEGEFVYKQEGFNLHTEPTYRKFITINL